MADGQQKEEPKIVSILPLEGGIEARIIESRKAAIPKGLTGAHYIVGLFKGGVELDFDAVSDDLDGKAYLLAKKFAREESQKEKFNRADNYRIVQNSSGAATRPNYHLHVIVLGHTREELEKLGFDIVRLVDPNSFVTPKLEKK